VVSRDHTERMMNALGVPIQVVGPMIVLDPVGWSRRWDGFEWQVPGDLSAAAFPIAAALLVRQSDVTICGVGINPTRTGLLDVLRSMRADLTIEPHGPTAGAEPVGDLRVRHGRLAPTMSAGEILTRMIDEVPAFCAIAAGASGRSDVRDAAELRVKESDRLSASASVLRAFGVDETELDDGMHIHGSVEGRGLRGACVDSLGDHRVAMMAAVLGMAAEGETVVEDVACVDTSFPGFASLMAGLGADITVEEGAEVRRGTPGLREDPSGE
jgi:3-phosphoshikimate 1-carboxyvinyltransferase